MSKKTDTIIKDHTITYESLFNKLECGGYLFLKHKGVNRDTLISRQSEANKMARKTGTIAEDETLYSVGNYNEDTFIIIKHKKPIKTNYGYSIVQSFIKDLK